MSEPVVFHYSTGKTRLLATGGGAVALVGVLMLVQDDWGAKVLGTVWIAVMLGLAFLLLRRAASREPVVTIDAQGILDRRISPAVIPWSDIRAIETVEAESLTFAGIDLNDEALSQTRFTWLHRIMRWPNRLLRFPSLSVAMHALDGTTQDFMTAVETFRPDLIRRH